MNYLITKFTHVSSLYPDVLTFALSNYSIFFIVSRIHSGIYIFLLIIVRNNIVAADAFKADRQAIEDNLGIERSYYYSKCMMLFWWGIPWIWRDDWILSRIISWPTVKYPKITLTFHIFLILIFSIVYAFFLKTPFQIVIYVLFIPVFFSFNVVIYLKPVAAVWIAILCGIPGLIVFGWTFLINSNWNLLEIHL